MNIVLIGMPGAGKSTLGVLLAKALGMAFIDTDLIIQENEGKLLQDILDQDGIDYFLAAEERAILALTAENAVISTGGSVVYSDEAMAHLKKNGLAIYLDASFEAIELRLSNISTRGVVIKPGCSLRDIYLEREPLYIKYADMTTSCSDEDAEGCVAQMVSLIRNSHSQ